MDVQSERVFALVSSLVSSVDGVQYHTVTPQPPPLALAPVSFTGVGGVSNPMLTMVEVLRRSFTYITTPSTTLVSGTAAGAVAVTLMTTGPSGIQGMLQGMPFVVSATGTPSAALGASAATTSTTIRKVLVTLGLSAQPTGISGGFALAGGTVQFVYGSAMNTSAMACTSASQALSFWDYVPLPMPSAGEVPLGWICVPNSFTAAQATIGSGMFTDYRVTQGINFSAMMLGLTQP